MRASMSASDVTISAPLGESSFTSVPAPPRPLAATDLRWRSQRRRAGTIELATSSKAASVPAARGKILGRRNILIVVATLEFPFVLWDFLFGRMSILFRDPLGRAESGVGDVLTKAYVACHPLLAIAALAFAAKGRVRHAIVTLGAIETMRWLNFM